MNADMLSNRKLNPIVTESFIRVRKLSISRVFITQSYFKEPKDVRLSTTHFFILKIPNKSELEQITHNVSSNIDFKDFMNLYRKCIVKHILFSLLMLLLHQIILYVSERIF